MKTRRLVRRRPFLAAEQAAEDVAQRTALAAQHISEDTAKGLVAGARPENADQNLAQGATGGELRCPSGGFRRPSTPRVQLFSDVCQYDRDQDRQQMLEQ